MGNIDDFVWYLTHQVAYVVQTWHNVIFRQYLSDVLIREHLFLNFSQLSKLSYNMKSVRAFYQT